jgi:2-polyprenyl-3-methyl-5-hydroxy-6-metoxy-1,4-benzoquinol methylase
MRRADFRRYRQAGIRRFEDILRAHEKGHCDEQGLPSYTHPNPLMRWLTWRRVQVVLNAIAAELPLQEVLDFGCGYGVFIPYLIEHADHTLAFDPMIAELQALGEAAGWPRVSYESDLARIAAMRQRFDLILAIEVLEHVEALEETVDLFYELLRPQGALLVSGPTENWLYQIGRKLAGYSGEYHLRDIYAVRQTLARRFHVRRIAAILPGLPFYEVYRCAKPSGQHG